MKPCEVYSWFKYQRRKPPHEFHGTGNHMSGSIIVRTLTGQGLLYSQAHKLYTGDEAKMADKPCAGFQRHTTMSERGAIVRQGSALWATEHPEGIAYTWINLEPA